MSDTSQATASRSQKTAIADDWWRGAVIYQIYPRSFADANGDGVGDLAGVIDKLDYVAALGVDGIWLSPFFTSPMKDFGYDVADYRDVDPLFGTLADFDALVERAHGLGLKVIIDQVWSHTSDKHPWFIDSAGSAMSEKADWYVWADAKADGSPPNNWQAVFGGPSWTWGPRRRQYYLHNFLIEQPDLNFWNPQVQEAILDVARFWLERGVDGFRLDVINFIFHDKALHDNPVAPYKRTPPTPTNFQRHIHDRSQPQALAFLARLRALTDSFDGRMTVGEIADTSPLERQQEYTQGPDRLHTAYSFYLLSANETSPALFSHALTSWANSDGWPSWSLGNHDVERFATRMAHGGAAQVKALMAVLMCLRGTIFLYQGEELGLPQARVPFEALRDPFALASYTGGSGRDGARTPMPWTAEGPAAGFSTNAQTWLPIDPAHRALSVAGQQGDADSVLAFTRWMIGLRRDFPALRLGEAAPLEAPPGVLAFERTLNGERLVCVFELSGRAAVFAAPSSGDLVASFGAGTTIEQGVARLPPFGGVIWRQVGRAMG